MIQLLKRTVTLLGVLVEGGKGGCRPASTSLVSGQGYAHRHAKCAHSGENAPR